MVLQFVSVLPGIFQMEKSIKLVGKQEKHRLYKSYRPHHLISAQRIVFYTFSTVANLGGKKKTFFLTPQHLITPVVS